jgi:hypothetical protein
MKRLTASIVICILAAFLTGCAKPCFYQAGKNLEQCKHDLLQCIQEANKPDHTSKNTLLSSIGAGMQKGRQPDEFTCLCMRAKGYRYLDINKLPQNQKRIMVAAPFEKYWVVDGAVKKFEDIQIVSEQNNQENRPDSPVKKQIKYQAQKDASGELMKDSSGNYIFAPVYEEEQQEIASLRQLSGK